MQRLIFYFFIYTGCKQNSLINILLALIYFMFEDNV